MGEHFCPECGFTADGPGDCPNCRIPMQSLGDELAGDLPKTEDSLEKPLSEDTLKTPRPAPKPEGEEGEDLFDDELPEVKQEKKEDED